MVNKEDHTLANMLRSHLSKDPHVLFAGYKGSSVLIRQYLFQTNRNLVPHPLFANFELRVQTDGEISPRDAVVGCCKALVNDLQILSREFTKEYELRKMISGDTGIDQ